MSKIMICGDTNWKDQDYIRKILSKCNKDDIIVHGKFPGVEFVINFYCQLLGLATEVIVNYNHASALKIDNLYSERLYSIYSISNPDKILVIDNNFENSNRYNFIKYVSPCTEIIVIKSVMYV